MSTIEDDEVEAFRAEWLKANDEGDMGNRVRRGIRAAAAVRASASEQRSPALTKARDALARHESQNATDPFHFPLTNHLYVTLRDLIDAAEPSGECTECHEPFSEHSCVPIPSCIHLAASRSHAELRAKAQAATPGPWFLDGMGEDEPEVNAWAHLFVGAQDGSGYAEVVATTEDRHGPNAQYIAAASPDVVLALIDRIGALESALAASRREPSEAATVACPHWSPGRITMRTGCTACAADAEPSNTDEREARTGNLT